MLFETSSFSTISTPNAHSVRSGHHSSVDLGSSNKLSTQYQCENAHGGYLLSAVVVFLSPHLGPSTF